MTAEIGVRLREARLQRGMSLRSVAQSVGVSASLISQVETGKTQPSVSTLYALVNHLGVSMDDLMGVSTPHAAADAPVSAPFGRSGAVEPAVQRGSENPVLEMENGVHWERLAVGEGGPADALLVSYDPGASSSIEGRLMRHSGVEYAYILEGEITLQLEFDTHLLRKGDSLQFDSVRPHLYSNNGDVVARGIWFVVGRRQQNQAMPSAMGADPSLSRGGDSPLTSAVDVLQAMDNLRP
ncbi:helix-turn-helix domain-containing protein [Lacisediminihabitans profunda]|uniref:Helix-turn-helix domain-containing protein n=1 Tax=Lacisediminihabitans profunda TaxID=2594790 RepID=A0A5C8ULW7_9MICO|nr:helix-turn-helix domain-containing protein [Lacisediminihabitans profunda]TXN29379.1 helix-turn-helix domain-containing protein [Lacisediminihabitans profunda]